MGFPLALISSFHRVRLLNCEQESSLRPSNPYSMRVCTDRRMTVSAIGPSKPFSAQMQLLRYQPALTPIACAWATIEAREGNLASSTSGLPSASWKEPFTPAPHSCQPSSRPTY